MIPVYVHHFQEFLRLKKRMFRVHLSTLTLAHITDHVIDICKSIKNAQKKKKMLF